MTIVADESVARQIVDRLRADGHNVWYVAEQAPSISDDRVLQSANDQHAILLTADKDFGELVYRMKRIFSGIVLVRLSGLVSHKKAELVAGVLTTHGSEIAEAFTVISLRTIRIRHRI